MATDAWRVVTESVQQFAARTGTHADAVTSISDSKNNVFVSGAASWRGPAGSMNQMVNQDGYTGTRNFVIEPQRVESQNYYTVANMHDSSEGDVGRTVTAVGGVDIAGALGGGGAPTA